MAAKKVTPKNITLTHKGASKTATTSTFEATNAAEGGTLANTGREILLLTTAAAEREVTFYDKNGASLGKTKLPESTVSAFGPFRVDLYGETVSFKTSNEAVKAAAFTLTNPHTVQIPT